MRSSLRLGTISGIPIGLHWSIAFIAGLFSIALAGTILPAAAPGYAGALYLAVGIGVTIALLAAIVAHELGHSLVAKNNDVGVKGITLFALGGVAQLERDPDDPGAAARIALAGPAVSVVIGIASLVAASAAATIGVPALLVAGLSWFGLVNLVMAVFNMLPALPLDGGRALQALLWKRRGDREKATISAASVGQYLGWAIVAFGAWQFFGGGSGLWTMFIGWFIATGAKAEAARARFELQRRQWAPPAWPQWPQWPGSPFTQGPPAPHAGPAPQSPPNAPWAPPPSDVIDVDGRRVG